MISTPPYQLLADSVLLIHFGIVVFVAGGLVLIVAGNLSGWAWVNRLWFRLAHVTAIGIVIAESWFGIICPLTSLEFWLRRQAGSPSYSESFIEHWVQYFLLYEAPSWVFTTGYTLFGLLVVTVWWIFPPTKRKSGNQKQS